jgi:hypothetical protein
MPFQIGQCCVDQIVNPGIGFGDLSGKNELINFTNVTTLTIQWNTTRKLRFGDAGVFYVEILGTDGIYRKATVEIKPNQIPNTTFYTIDFGGLASGRVTIT